MLPGLNSKPLRQHNAPNAKKIVENTHHHLREGSIRSVDRSKVAGRNLPMSYRKNTGAKFFGGCALLE